MSKIALLIAACICSQVFLSMLPVFGQYTAEYWFEKGNEYFADGNDDDALHAYEEAIKLNPSYVDAWYNKGTALQRLGKGDEAQKAFTKSQELFSKASSTEQKNVTTPASTLPKSPENFDHSIKVGTPGISEFLINWTDKLNSGTLSPESKDLESSNGDITTMFTITRTMPGENDTRTGGEVMQIFIIWEPNSERSSNANLENYPLPLAPDNLIFKKSISINGKSGIFTKSGESKVYMGTSEPPLFIPGSFIAKWFLDKHTTIQVNAYGFSHWTESGFLSTINSMKITAPVW